jgi:hypothetical protein
MDSRMLRSLRWTVLSLLLAASPCRADTGDLIAALPKGVYVAAGGGVAFQDFGPNALGNPRLIISIFDLESGMFDLRAGWQFHERFAAELLWQHYTGWDLFTQGTPNNTHERGFGLTMNLKAYLALWQIRPFVLVGAGLGSMGNGARIELKDQVPDPDHPVRVQNNDYDEGVLLRFGGGLDAFPTDSFSVGIESAYNLALAGLDELSFSTVGLVLAWHLQ